MYMLTPPRPPVLLVILEGGADLSSTYFLILTITKLFPHISRVTITNSRHKMEGDGCASFGESV